MKKTLLLSLLIVTALSIYAVTATASLQNGGTNLFAAEFSWSKTSHDFGTIKQGIPQTAVFEFTNTGNAPLIISDAKGSCGCTIADYTKGAIPPNGKGSVSANYNAAALGTFNKTVTITANVPESTFTLTIKGEVVAADGK